MLNSLVLEACGHVAVGAGSITTASTWLYNCRATWTAQGVITITLARAIEDHEAVVTLTAMSGATYANMMYTFTADTTLVIYADDVAGTGSGGGAYVDAISFDFKVERKPGT